MESLYLYVAGSLICEVQAECVDDVAIEDLIEENIDEIRDIPGYPMLNAWIEDDYGNSYHYQSSHLEDLV